MKPIQISCLPVAGISNPYQHLMMQGLNSDSQLIARNGVDDKFFGIIRTAITQNPDYIHFDWESSYYYRRVLWMSLLNIPFFMFQVMIVKYILRIKLVWTLHNILPHDVRHIRIHRFCRRFFARQMIWIRVFSNSSIIRASEELRAPSRKFKVVPEGSYVDYYPNTIAQKEARKILNINEKARVFLYFGLLKPYKGITELIEEFQKINAENSFLIIAGKSMDKLYFKEILSVGENLNRISVIDNFIPVEEIQIFLNAADFVVLPFRKIENSGSAILAMSFKRVVIAPLKGVLPERLSAQPEFLFKDLSDLGSKIKLALNTDNEIILEIGRQNFSQVESYKWSDFSKSFTCENDG